MSQSSSPIPEESRPDTSGFVLPDATKLEAMAEFAAGAGHEINNPLATIIGRAQLLLKDERDPQRRQMLLAIGAQAYRIRDMIGDAMLFGRPPTPELQPVDLAHAVSDILRKQADDLATDHCTASVEIPSGLILQADSTQLAIVLSELLRNSRQALQSVDGGEIHVRANSRDEFAIIEIVDRGQGFTEIERQHAFDPFFSGRQAGRGLGFGLSKCWRIIQQHNGRVEIESTPTGSTIVRVTWPRF
ncbi:MAG: HAMP domain-containing histidine kinase [Planctomycetaceae bacterium]|nr:HAMP domain-containing histidine kinase [Planctomycetaceae bacterium]